MDDTPDEPLTRAAELLIGLLPAGVTWHASGDPATAGPLLPAEAAITARMAPARLASFRHGRHCARRALAPLGLGGTAIPMGDQREPVWPPGMVGSIAHAGRLAAAAVAPATRLAGLGIDLERADQLDAAAARLVCTGDELRQLHSRPAPLNDPTLLFCMKEAVYKCIWPQLRRFVDFREVAVSPDPASGCFSARALAEGLDRRLLAAVQGRYVLREGLVVAAAWLAVSWSSASTAQPASERRPA